MNSSPIKSARDADKFKLILQTIRFSLSSSFTPPILKIYKIKTLNFRRKNPFKFYKLGKFAIEWKITELPVKHL